MNQQKFVTFCFFLYILRTVKNKIRIFEARGLIFSDNINLINVKHLGIFQTNLERNGAKNRQSWRVQNYPLVTDGLKPTGIGFLGAQKRCCLGKGEFFLLDLYARFDPLRLRHL
jgi:hypothetical protein